MIGFDYGIKPNILVMSDVEFPNLIHEGKVRAVAYGRLPYYELLNEPMFVSLVFEDDEKGEECFKHFKEWINNSNNSEAVSLSFIELNNGGYTVCVYPDYALLIDRCIPHELQKKVHPIIFTPISFPITVERVSQQFIDFQSEID